MYLLEEVNEFKPEYYYWAAIAAEVAKGHTKNPGRIKIADRILEFVFKKKKVQSVESTFDPDEVDRKISASKSAWFAASGLNSAGEWVKKKFIRKR